MAAAIAPGTLPAGVDAADVPQTGVFIARLAARGSPDALAAAALLAAEAREQGRSAPDPMGLMTSALQQEPQRPDLAWLAVRLCSLRSECSPESYEEKLRGLDPQNAAGWFDALRRAGEDAVAVDAVLEKIASARRLDTYWNALLVRTAAELASARAPGAPAGGRALEIAVGTVMGPVSVVALPAVVSLVDLCTLRAGATERRAALCREVAVVLERGDTVIVEAIGLELTRRLWPEGSAQARAAEARRRTLMEHVLAAGPLTDPVSRSDDQAGAYFAALLAHRREQDALFALIEEAVPPAEPPAGAAGR